MNYQLTAEQEMVQKMLKQFTKEELDPIADDLDKTETFPSELIKKMGKIGNDGRTVSKRVRRSRRGLYRIFNCD